MIPDPPPLIMQRIVVLFIPSGWSGIRKLAHCQGGTRQVQRPAHCGHPLLRIVLVASRESSLVLQPATLSSESRGFITLKVRIIAGKEQALQTFRLAKDITWHPLPLDLKEIGQSVDRDGDAPVDKRVPLG